MQWSFSPRNVVRRAPGKPRRGAPRRRLIFDYLEDRRMLSGGSLTTPGTAVTVDSSGTATLINESPRAVAMDSAGDAVVAWTDQNPSTGTWNLMFQQYTKSYDGATGLDDLMAPVGSSVTVVSNVTVSALESQGSIMVAMGPTNGDFVVVWGTGTGATKSNPNGTTATHAQLYNPAGSKIGGALLVGGSGDHLPKSVAMDDGGFDVLYGNVSTSRHGESYALAVQRYGYTSSSDAAIGSPISVVTPGFQGYGNAGASMAMDGGGNFVVAWEDWVNNSTTDTQYINAERFTSAGKGQGVIQVASANKALNQGVTYGDVAMDSAGNFVVDWIYDSDQNGTFDDFLQARQFTSGGGAVQPQANPISIAQTELDSNGHSTSSPEGPGGLAETGGGAFDVSWTNVAYPAQYSIAAATYDGLGNQMQTLQVTSLSSLSIGASSVAVDGNGDLFVVWSSNGNVDGEFFLDPPAPAPATGAPTASSPSGTASPSGTSSAATDAAFAAYAFPDDDTLA